MWKLYKIVRVRAYSFWNERWFDCDCGWESQQHHDGVSEYHQVWNS